MAQSRKLQVEIIGDASSLQKAFGHATSGSSKLGSTLKTLGKVAAVGVGAAFAGLAATLKVGFDELAEGQKVMAQTQAALKSTGGVANVTAKQIEALASEQSKLTGIDDELIQSSENLLLTFKNVRNELGKGNDVFNQATEAALDLSVAGFGSVESASKMMGKALNDPIKGMTALGRAGVTFSEEQKKAIKALVDSNHLLDAQKIILGEVESQVGGSAKAYGETLPGQLSKLRNSFEELAAKVAEAVLPALMGVVEFLNSNMPAIEAVITQTMGTISSAIEQFAPTAREVFETARQNVQNFIDTARQILPTLQSLGGIVLSVGLSSFGQSAIAATASMIAFHSVAARVAEALVRVREAAVGAGLASLIGPVGILTAGIGLLAFAFYKTKIASDDAVSSFDRQKAALLGLKDAASQSAQADQRLRDAKIALKQAILDVSTALQRRTQLEHEGKKGTDEFKQAQLDVERAISNRKRAELDVSAATKEAQQETAKTSQALKRLSTDAEEARGKAERVASALGRIGEEGKKTQIVAGYAAELDKLAKKAGNIAETTAKMNPEIATAALRFKQQAEAAANLVRSTGEIPKAFNNAVEPSRSAGHRIGEALGSGIVAGIAASSSGVEAAARGVVQRAEAAARAQARAKSPSELFAAIGYDIGAGMRQGLISQYAALSEAATTAVDKMISAAAQKITESRSVFESAFSELTSAALSAFDKLSSDFETKTEAKIRKQDERRAAQERKDALRDAKSDVQKAQAELDAIGPVGLGASPEQRAAFEAASQQMKQALEAQGNAEFAIQRAALEKAAEQERKDYEAKRERQRFHLEQRLSALQNSFLQGEITVQQFTARMTKILEKADIPLRNAAARVGLALAAGLLEAKKDAVNAARELAEAIQSALGNISVSVRVHVSGAEQDRKRQHGGPVRRNEPYLVGEAGPELFVPSVSGRIISNTAMSRAGAGGGGGSFNLTVHAPYVIGTPDDLARALQPVIQQASADWKRRNGGSLI